MEFLVALFFLSLLFYAGLRILFSGGGNSRPFVPDDKIADPHCPGTVCSPNGTEFLTGAYSDGTWTTDGHIAAKYPAMSTLRQSRQEGARAVSAAWDRKLPAPEHKPTAQQVQVSHGKMAKTSFAYDEDYGIQPVEEERVRVYVRRG